MHALLCSCDFYTPYNLFKRLDLPFLHLGKRLQWWYLPFFFSFTFFVFINVFFLNLEWVQLWVPKIVLRDKPWSAACFSRTVFLYNFSYCRVWEMFFFSYRLARLSSRTKFVYFCIFIQLNSKINSFIITFCSLCACTLEIVLRCWHHFFSQFWWMQKRQVYVARTLHLCLADADHIALHGRTCS